MNLLQPLYRRALIPLVQWNTRDNRPKRDLVVFALFLLFFLLIAVSPNVTLFMDENEEITGPFIFTVSLILDRQGRAIVGIILLIIVAILGGEASNVRIRWNWYISLLWAIVFAICVIAGLAHDIGSGYLLSMWAIFLLFPFVFYVWQSSHRLDQLYFLVSCAYCIAILVFGILSILWYPVNDITTSVDNRYAAFANHPNTFAVAMGATAIPSFYLLHKGKVVFWILSSMSLGMSITMVLLTGSRAAFLGMTVAIIVMVVLYAKGTPRAKGMVLFVLITAVSALGTNVAMNNMGEEAATLSPNAIFSMTVAYGEDEINQQPEEKDVWYRLFNVGKDQGRDAVSSGRFSIWQAYRPYLNMTGNDVTYALPITLKYSYVNHVQRFQKAHNSVLEVAFRCGIPAGLGYLMLQVLGMIYIVTHMLGSRRILQPYDVFACGAIVMYVIVGNLETAVVWSDWPVICFFFLGLAPLFVFGVKQEEEGDPV